MFIYNIAMLFIFYAFEVCIFSVSYTAVNSYVLFAANVDDFRSIAKKFVPEKLADQIADMASNNFKKNKPVRINVNTDESDVINDDVYEKERDSLSETVESDKDRIVKAKTNERSKKISHIDIDDLVRKVKLKLEEEFINKLVSKKKSKDKTRDESYEFVLKSTQHDDLHEAETNLDAITPKYNKKENTKYKNNYDNYAATEHIERFTDKRYTVKHQTQTVSQRYKQNSKANLNPQKPRNKKPNFDTDDTQTNDNFDENYQKYSSQFDRITKNWKLDNNKQEIKKMKSPSKQLKEPTVNLGTDKFSAIATSLNDSYEDYVIPPKEDRFASKESDGKVTIKHQILPHAPREGTQDDEGEIEYYNDSGIHARTESLIFNKNANPKERKGTMIPTREVIKISSPNYLKKIPVQAEKYDFNEPLPEQDREEEKMKYFPQIPSNINGKVKLRNELAARRRRLRNS